MPLRCFASNVTQSAFSQRKHDMRLETLHCLFQRVIGCQRPDEILIIGNPRGQPRAKPALSQSMNEIRQPQLRIDEEVVGKVCVAGDVQFKRITLHQLSVHNNSDATVVPWRNYADQKNSRFHDLCHLAGSESVCDGSIHSQKLSCGRLSLVNELKYRPGIHLIPAILMGKSSLRLGRGGISLIVCDLEKRCFNNPESPSIAKSCTSTSIAALPNCVTRPGSKSSYS